MMTSLRLVSLWDMYSFDASAFMTATQIIHVLLGKVGAWSKQDQSTKMTQTSVTSSIEMLTKLDSALAALHVPVTKIAIKENREVILAAISDGATYFDIGQRFVEISNTLRREISTSSVFVLDNKRAEFYSPITPLFGEQVSANFPGIGDEIGSAGKCFACDLPTAFAFHSIRCMEAGIRAVARYFAIPDPTTGADRNWSNIAKAISAAMEKKWPTSTSRMNPEAKSVEAIYGALKAIMNPYRNETMHLSATYSATEALHIFELVKGLMQKIASLMDENGSPAPWVQQRL